MPERLNKFRVPSPELQGADSFVIFREIDWCMVEAAMRLDAGDRSANEQWNHELVRMCVVEWNWVDDTGKALPTPADGLDLGRLSGREMDFLIGYASGRTQAKN